MPWPRLFSAEGTSQPGGLSIRSVKFDRSGWRSDKKFGESQSWRDIDEDILTVSLNRTPDDGPLERWALAGLIAGRRETAASRAGGIVSVELTRARGIPIARVISKFRDGLGYEYEGALMVPFRHAVYAATMQAFEHGTTGTREAVVTGHLFSQGELKVPAARGPGVSHKLEGWFRDPYDTGHAGPTLHSLSDDERLDALLPEHPLSKVRRWFTTVEGSLEIDEDVRQEIVEPHPAAAGLQFPPPHRMSSRSLGVLYLSNCMLDDAERLLAESIPLCDNEPDLDAPNVADHLSTLGATREGLGRTAEAEWAHRWALRACRATLGDADVKTMQSSANLARVYTALGRHEEAEPLLMQALPVFERLGLEADTGLALNALGLVHQKQSRHADALSCFERALTIFEKLYGPRFCDCATVLQNMATSLEAIGDHRRRKQVSSRAEDILRSL